MMFAVMNNAEAAVACVAILAPVILIGVCLYFLFR